MNANLNTSAPNTRPRSDVLIKLENIHKSYFSGEVETPVLHGINVTIQHGEFVAIMGQSGSGKSTLMNILGCLDRPTAGDYLLNGEPVSRMNRNDRRPKFRRLFWSISARRSS